MCKRCKSKEMAFDEGRIKLARVLVVPQVVYDRIFKTIKNTCDEYMMDRTGRCCGLRSSQPGCMG